MSNPFDPITDLCKDMYDVGVRDGMRIAFKYGALLLVITSFIAFCLGRGL
jgi:hypothetical protein